MVQDYFKPLFLIEIEGKSLSKDITQEITSFVFTDNEKELDVLELAITNRNLQFCDDPLFQEGNEIRFRFGYADDLSPSKKAVIKEIEYDFPESGEPSMTISVAARRGSNSLHGNSGNPSSLRNLLCSFLAALISFSRSISFLFSAPISIIVSASAVLM